MQYNEIVSDTVSLPRHAVEVERPVIWNVMTVMWHFCINQATKRDFGITTEYISNERVWIFPLLLTGHAAEQTAEWLVI